VGQTLAGGSHWLTASRLRARKKARKRGTELSVGGLDKPIEIKAILTIGLLRFDLPVELCDHLRPFMRIQ